MLNKPLKNKRRIDDTDTKGRRRESRRGLFVPLRQEKRKGIRAWCSSLLVRQVTGSRGKGKTESGWAGCVNVREVGTGDH